MYANNFFDDLSYSSIVVPSYRLIEVTIKKYFVKPVKGGSYDDKHYMLKLGN